jgi:hypothetical protein
VNTVKEIDLSTKKVKDLFSANASGVFIYAYDRAKKHIYYNTGCYNCDGNSNDKLLLRNLADNSDSTVLANNGKSSFGATIPNSTVTKLLLIAGTVSETELGSTPPYTLREFDVASKQAKDLLTISEDIMYSTVGYRDGGGIYYVKGNALYGLNESGASSVLYQSDKPILDVFYVGNDAVVVSTGEYNDYRLIKYNLADKSSANILNGDEKTRIFGVTWN